MSLHVDISNGVYDNELEAVIQSSIARRKTVGQMAALSVKMGDRVRISDTLRPVKFRGLFGTVVDRKNSLTVVKLELTEVQKWVLGTAQRYLSGPGKDEVSLPPGTFKRVED